MSADVLMFRSPAAMLPPEERAREKVRSRLRLLVSNLQIAVAEADVTRLVSRGMLVHDAVERVVNKALSPPDPDSPLAA